MSKQHCLKVQSHNNLYRLEEALFKQILYFAIYIPSHDSQIPPQPHSLTPLHTLKHKLWTLLTSAEATLM